MSRLMRLLLLPLACVVLTTLSSAQMSVSPPGGSISVGSSVAVTNSGTTTGIVAVNINGQITVLGSIPAGGARVFPVPNDPSLVGLCVELLTWQAGDLDSYEFCFTA